MTGLEGDILYNFMQKITILICFIYCASLGDTVCIALVYLLINVLYALEILEHHKSTCMYYHTYGLMGLGNVGIN